MPGPVIAAIDPGAFLYLIIMLFWAIAKVAQLARRKSKPGKIPPPSAPDPRREVPPMNEDLREMLETLTGHKFEIPRPEPARVPPPPPPPPQPAVRPPPIPARNQKADAPRRQRPAQAPAPARPTERTRAAPAGVTAELRNVPLAPAYSPTVQKSSVAMKQVTATPFQFTAGVQTTSRHGKPAEALLRLKSQGNLRQGILSQVILGPPKALQG